MALEIPEGLAWREGMSQWLPISQISELRGAGPGVPLGAPPVPPVPPVPGMSCHEVDYRVFGAEMQYLEVELDPGETAMAEAGAMMYKDPSIHMESIFGDGSGREGSGFMGKLMGAGKRVLMGESLFMTAFTNNGGGKANVAFAAPFPGNIVPVDLGELGGEIICQKDSFLCAAKGVSIDIYLQKKILTGLFGGEGFIMERLTGDGMAFMNAGGTVLDRELASGETLDVDTGCVVAFMPSVQMDIRQAGNIKTSLFGGEGLFFATLKGPGRIWLQSLPFSRLAGRMLQAAPQRLGSKDQGEGSILDTLGGLGGLIGGDRSF
ncbi:TIGR00266 family protein [Dethiosulfovibrio sp. F2B]|nr:TIGR00266 family protein [Dethiosulfovibrio faecalis]